MIGLSFRETMNYRSLTVAARSECEYISGRITLQVGMSLLAQLRGRDKSVILGEVLGGKTESAGGWPSDSLYLSGMQNVTVGQG